MKRICIAIVVAFMAFSTACKKSSEISTREGPGTNSAMAQFAPESSQPSTAAPVPLNNPPYATPLATTESGAATGMNPPHGQPNHRCDIAVGVPLDSPPGTGKSTPPGASQQMPIQIKPGQSSTPIQINPPQITSTPIAPGMNPPHGQPNHRCDIGVGVPLDSPPGTGKPTRPVNSLNSSPIQIVPAPNPDASKK